MIQCTDDVCNLIASKTYTANTNPWRAKNVMHYVFTAGSDNNRIEISFDKRGVEIYAFQNKNSKFYAHLSCDVFAENEKVKKLRNILAANIAAKTRRAL